MAWARHQGATVVVSIGEFDDAEDADVALGGKIDVSAAIDAIARRLGERRKAAA